MAALGLGVEPVLVALADLTNADAVAVLVQAVAARCLLDRAATPAATPVRLELATRLIERQSVAAAPPAQA